MRSNLPIFALAAAQLAVAKQVGYFQSESCAAPSDFESCYDEADEGLADCINENCDALGVDCHNACECAKQVAYTQCAVSYCWNMVHSCEYQLQVGDQVNSCLNPDLDAIPFWPPPDHANGRCNCKIGEIIKAQVLVNEVLEGCSDLVDPFAQSIDQMQAIGNACLCCGVTGFLSPFYSFCPRLAPAELGLQGAESVLGQGIPDFEWTQCGSWMSGYDCAGDFGFPASVETYYGPGEFPKDGTETLRNIGALTTPASPTATFIVGNEQVLVTAVSTDAAVPTGASDIAETTNGSDSSDSSDSSDTSDDSSQSGSDDEQGANNDQTPKDLAIRQAGISPKLAGFAVAVAGLLVLE
ncbi:uncharacterized protein BJX67DRAFT_289406 [Aspergillus lucknowensis]|uniref:Extracellular membrane protein CFEM domain-containing protein n=1 Tax=Aspergillus lucknowensis TaxID=176173 RepID=A0ABR4LE98_9EURO